MPPLTCSKPECKRRPYNTGWAMCDYHSRILLRAFGDTSSSPKPQPVRRLWQERAA